MSYAEKTTVSEEQSRMEIERLLVRYGATSFAYGFKQEGAFVEFVKNERRIRFLLDFPDKESFRHFKQKGRVLSQKRTDIQTHNAWTQFKRQRWRALLLVIKAKLEAVESQIVLFEQEFLAHIVMPDGQTVAEKVIPIVEQAYLTGRTFQLQLNAKPDE